MVVKFRPRQGYIREENNNRNSNNNNNKRYSNDTNNEIHNTDLYHIFSLYKEDM
jgi:hypothetical protein